MENMKIQQFEENLKESLAGDSQDQIIQAYIDLGQAYLTLKETPKAYTQFDLALKIAENNNDELSQAKLLGSIGICLQQLGNFESALQSLERSLTIARNNENKLLEGDAQFHIGVLLSEQGKPLEAISHLDNALAMAIQNQDNTRKLAVTNLMGNIFLGLESIDKAIENYATALDTSRDLNNKEAEAASRIHLGQTFLVDGTFDAAIENFEYALAIADEHGLVQIELQALNGLTDACSGAGNSSLAVIYAEQAINKARGLDLAELEVIAIQSLIRIHTQKEHYQKTISLLQRGLDLSREKQVNEWELTFLTDLGTANYYADDLDQAQFFLEQAYEFAQKHQFSREVALVGGLLASIHADQGNTQASSDLILNVIELAEELEFIQLKAEQLVLLGMNFQETKDNNKAQGAFKEAIKLFADLERDDLVQKTQGLLETVGGK